MDNPPETWSAADGTVVTIRSISTADLALEEEFVDALSAPTRYQRFMSARRPSREELKRFTDIDPERELALIATTQTRRTERQIGVVRYIKEPSSGGAEFAIVLSDDWQGCGLGSRLLVSLLNAAKRRAVQRLKGMTLSENRRMLALGRKLGFSLATDPGWPAVTNLTVELAAWPPAGTSGIDSRSR